MCHTIIFWFIGIFGIMTIIPHHHHHHHHPYYLSDLKPVPFFSFFTKIHSFIFKWILFSIFLVHCIVLQFSFFIPIKNTPLIFLSSQEYFFEVQIKQIQPSLKIHTKKCTIARESTSKRVSPQKEIKNAPLFSFYFAITYPSFHFPSIPFVSHLFQKSIYYLTTYFTNLFKLTRINVRTYIVGS